MRKKTVAGYGVILVPTEGIVRIEPRETEEVVLEALQDWVGGYIETVPTVFGDGWVPEADGLLLVVNEERRLEGLPENTEATLMQGAGIPYPIVGNAVLVAYRGEEMVALRREDCLRLLRHWGGLEK
jgi:hypothetical protein